MAGHPPRGQPPTDPVARRPHRACRPGGLWLGPHSHTPAPTARGWRSPTARPVGGQSGEGQRLTSDAPHTMVEGTPPGDALLPPPQRATPARKGARCGTGAGSPRPHRPHPGHEGRGILAARSRGRAAGGGTAPDTRRPSQWWKAPPPGTPFRQPHSEQRRPVRAHAVGPVLGPQASTDRIRDTRVADPWLPAPEDGGPGEGQRLTPDAPQNGGRPTPPGTVPHHPRGTQPPQGTQAKGTVLCPHTQAPAPTAHGWRTQTARPVGGQSGEGQRLTSDAPHTMVEGSPPGDALPPTPQRATPARKGARCGAGAGSPSPHRPHPGHTGRRTPAARPRGRAAGRGTAPDTRRPSQRWQTDPPGDGPPPPPRHAAPIGHTGQGDSVGPPHPHTRDHSMSVTDPNRPPSGRAVQGGGAPDDRRPSQRWKAPPPGTPFRHPHSEQRRPARVHAVGPVLDPHARTGRTRDTRVAEPRLPAPEGRWRGEGQRLTPDAPHNGGRPPPPPRGRPPTTPTARSPHRACRPRGQCWAPTPTHPRPQHVGGGPQQPAQWAGSRGRGAPDLRRPSQRWKAPPPGMPFRHPHSEQRRPARAHAVGPVLGPHARTDRTRDTRVAEPRLPAPEDGRPGEGQRLTPDAPQNGGRAPPPGTAPHHPRSTQPPQGMQAKGTVFGPHTHTPAPTARG